MKKKEKEQSQQVQKPLVIMSASLNDGLCNYSFEIKSGVGEGFTHTVKGKGIADEDLNRAFFPLNTHLAIIDDIFKHSGIEIDKLSSFYTHELSQRYTVVSFKVIGEEENEQVILIGTKRISCSGNEISIQTPKIPIDVLSSYPWAKALKSVIDSCRDEVELYHGGKYTPVETNTLSVDENQMNIGHVIDDVDFEVAKK